MIHPSMLMKYLRLYYPGTTKIWGDSSAVLDNLMRQAQFELWNYCRPGHGQIYFPSTAGTREYNLPEYVMNVLSVYYNNTEIFPITYDELDRLHPFWQQASGVPQYYYIGRLDRANRTDIVQGLETQWYIGFYPEPADTGSWSGFSAELGTEAAIVVDGVNATFNQEEGIVEYIEDGSVVWTAQPGATGVMSQVSTGTNFFSLWIDVWPSEIKNSQSDTQSPYWEFFPNWVDRLYLDFTLWKLHELRRSSTDKEAEAGNAIMANHHRAAWEKGLERFKIQAERRTLDQRHYLQPSQISGSKEASNLGSHYPNPWRNR